MNQHLNPLCHVVKPADRESRESSELNELFPHVVGIRTTTKFI